MNGFLVNWREEGQQRKKWNKWVFAQEWDRTVQADKNQKCREFQRQTTAMEKTPLVSGPRN